MALDTAKATATLRSLTHKFDNKIKAATPFYPNLCTIIPSDGANEQYAMLGNVPGVREWIGDRAFKELRAANFVIENKLWENSLKIAKTDLADDRMGLYGPTLEQLAMRAAYHPDELLLADALPNGESRPCFDGQQFFDTDHSWGDSGTQSNDLTYNASDHTAVTAAEFRAAFHQARAAMLGFKNDQGDLLNVPIVTGMSKLMCIVPAQLELQAYEGLYSTLTGGGNTNIVIDRPQIVVCPYLTSATKFYLFNLGGVLKPFVFQAREPLSRKMKDLEDMESKDVKFMTQARYNVGYLAWWTGVLTTFN